jgi:hypothetical protein
MENVPKELIKTQSTAVRNLQIRCRRRQGELQGCSPHPAQKESQREGPQDGVCGQRALGVQSGVTVSPRVRVWNRVHGHVPWNTGYGPPSQRSGQQEGKIGGKCYTLESVILIEILLSRTSWERRREGQKWGREEVRR